MLCPAQRVSNSNGVFNTPSLISEGRDESRGRERWSSEFRRLLADFFTSRTAILSGADTETRRLLMNKGRLEAEFESQYPSMLRKLLKLEPSIRPEPKSTVQLTALQKNALAAEAAGEEYGFSEAEEYKSRLEGVFQR